MSVEQRDIWDRNWEIQSQTNPKEILSSRFTQEAYRCIKNFIDKDDKLILEVGCGTGRFCCLLAKDFPDSQVLGIDISPNSLKIANFLKEYLCVPNVSFENGDLFQIPYCENYFDVVFSEGVIEHFSLEEKPNYKDAFKEMIRVAKRRGKVIVSVPNWYCFPHTIYKWFLEKLSKQYKYGYEKSFKHSELIELFSEFGLEEIVISGFYPSYGFSRFRGRGIHKIFGYFGKLADLIQLSDYFVNKNFTKKFGFEIMAKGIKP